MRTWTIQRLRSARLVSLLAVVAATGIVEQRWVRAEWTVDMQHAAGRSASEVLLVGLLLALTAGHYAIGVAGWRAAAGTALPFRDTYLIQLVAAAANRVTPGGIGGAAVNLRFLHRQGLSRSRATGAIVGVRLVGMLADAALLGLLLALGLGSSAAAHLGTHVLRHPVVVISLVAVMALGLTFGLWRHRGAAVTAARDLTALARRPLDLAVLLAASVGTTLVLAGSLVAALAIITGPGALAHLPTYLAAYMIASAVGNAAGVPSGIGTVDAALTGALLASGVPLHAALPTVVLFRATTFWAPAAAGLVAGHRLRKASAL